MPIRLEEAMEHPNIPSPPSPETTIWRFLSLSKFLDLIVSQQLFFSQLAMLRKGDPFENTLPKLNAIHAKRILSEPEYANQFLPDAEGKARAVVKEFYGENHLRQMLNYYAKAQYISCWHEADYEPQGLWKLYATEYDGVAVKTTFGQLLDSIDDKDDHWIYPGRIEYVDFEKVVFDTHNGFHALFRKLQNFEFEKELRLVFSHHAKDDGEFFDQVLDNPTGVKVGLDVGSAIDSVIVGPNCEDWAFSMIETLSKRLGYNFTIVRSELSRKPYLG